MMDGGEMRHTVAPWVWEEETLGYVREFGAWLARVRTMAEAKQRGGALMELLKEPGRCRECGSVLDRSDPDLWVCTGSPVDKGIDELVPVPVEVESGVEVHRWCPVCGMKMLRDDSGEWRCPWLRVLVHGLRRMAEEPAADPAPDPDPDPDHDPGRCP